MQVHLNRKFLVLFNGKSRDIGVKPTMKSEAIILHTFIIVNNERFFKTRSIPQMLKKPRYLGAHSEMQKFMI